MTARTPPPLRAYQREVAAAVLESVRRRHGDTIVFTLARQGGKNETQVRIEAALLLAHVDVSGAIVKTAPTLEPQLKTSFVRLADYLSADAIPHRTAWPQLFVGRAFIDMRSAEPTANVVGATASIMLEADEAQDIDPDIFDVRFRPMASTTNATTLMCGTAWNETSLLERAIQEGLERERADGRRRVFKYDWRTVAEHNPLYARYVAGERQRLGPDHPLFTTQYELVPLPGGGRLFNPTQIQQLQGTHARLRAPLLNETYVAGLDLGGEDTGSDRPNDATVLTIARLDPPDTAQAVAGVRPARVVDHIEWRGAPHAELIPALRDVITQRRVRRLAVDATGVGQPTALILARTARGCGVEPIAFTQQSKSALGFGLITAVNTGAMKLYADDGSPERRRCLGQCRLAKMETRPNRTMNFYVDERDGNDDYLTSLALTAHAAANHTDRKAIGRRND